MASPGRTIVQKNLSLSPIAVEHIKRLKAYYHIPSESRLIEAMLAEAHVRAFGELTLLDEEDTALRQVAV